MLARAFAGQARGFYIDVGAMDPVSDSVTQHFYALGWHGINIEPSLQHYQHLVAARPRDLNLNVALGEREETREFLDVPDSGLSRLGEDPPASEAASSPSATLRNVRVTTLAKIWAEHVGGRTVDFLKIDVEGWERHVIAGGDWQRFRPRIVLVEATRPNSAEPAWAEWEPDLLGNGYLFAWFDGLNRFYVRREEADLLRHFAVPPNVFDGFMPWRVERLMSDLEKARAEHARLSESHLLLIAEQVETKAQLAYVYGSKSWRVTAPLRWLVRHLGRSGTRAREP